MSKISIILPVYNVSSFLAQSLDSLLGQTVPDIQIICVNDGSTDNSLEILEEYARKNENISVISQENQGAGVARNTGLAQVKSDYVAFLDPDDFVTPTMYEKMYAKAMDLQADMVLCGAENFNHTSQSFYVAPLYEMQQEDIPEGLFSYEGIGKSSLGVFHSNPCNRLISMAYLQRINLKFQEIFRHDGFHFTHTSYLSTDKLAFVFERCYKYRTHITGSSSATNHRYPLDKYKAHLKLKETLKTIQAPENLWFFYQSVAILDTLHLMESASQTAVFQIIFQHFQENGEKDFSGTKIPEQFLQAYWQKKYRQVLEGTSTDYLFSLYRQVKDEKESIVALHQKEEICFFGAGGYGRYLLKKFQECHLKPPVALIDTYKSGTVIQGIPVLSLADCVKKYPNATVFLTTKQDSAEIKKELALHLPQEQIHSIFDSPWDSLLL